MNKILHISSTLAMISRSLREKFIFIFYFLLQVSLGVSLYNILGQSTNAIVFLDEAIDNSMKNPVCYLNYVLRNFEIKRRRE